MGQENREGHSKDSENLAREQSKHTRKELKVVVVVIEYGEVWRARER